MLGNVKAHSDSVGHVFVLTLLGLSLLENKQEQCCWKAYEIICPGRICPSPSTRVLVIILAIHTCTDV